MTDWNNKQERAQYFSEHYQKNKVKVAAYRKEWVKRNPDKARAQAAVLGRRP